MQTLFQHNYTKQSTLARQPYSSEVQTMSAKELGNAQENPSYNAPSPEIVPLEKSTTIGHKRRLVKLFRSRPKKIRKVQSKIPNMWVRKNRVEHELQPTNIESIFSTVRTYLEPIRKRLRRSSNDPKNDR